MLTYEDGEPSIRHAIWRRLGKETGVAIADIQIKPRKAGDRYVYDGEPKVVTDDHIAVGVWLILKDSASDDGIVDIRSFFELPPEFHMSRVRNEIDEIAESCKAARRKAGLSVTLTPVNRAHREMLTGTGLRGRWES